MSSTEKPKKVKKPPPTESAVPLVILASALFFLLMGFLANGFDHPIVSIFVLGHNWGHLRETFHVVTGWISLFLLTIGMAYVPLKYLVKIPKYKSKDNLRLMKELLPVHKWVLLISLVFASAHLVFSEDHGLTLLITFGSMCIVSISGYLMFNKNLAKSDKKKAQEVHRQQFLTVVFFGMFAFSHLTSMDIRQEPPLLPRTAEEAHMYWGECGSCHNFSQDISFAKANQWRLPPVTRGKSVMPHRHYGVCLNCHEPTGPQGNVRSINQGSRYIHRRNFRTPCSGCHHVEPLPAGYNNPASMFIKSLDQDSELTHQWLGVCSNCHQVVTDPNTFFSIFDAPNEVGQ